MRKIDPFLLLIMGAVAAASVIPAQSRGAEVLDTLGIVGIALLFFVHGAALRRWRHGRWLNEEKRSITWRA